MRTQSGLIMALLGAIALPASAAVALQSPMTTPQQLIVKLRPNVNVQISQSAAGVTAYSADARFSTVLQRLGITRLRPLFAGIALRSRSSSVLARASLYGLDRIHLLSLPAGDRGAALRALKADPAVEYVEVDQKARTLAVNDPYLATTGSWGQSYGDLWGLTVGGVTGAWNRSTGAGVTVAVVDTGVDVNHEDLAANIAVNSGEIPGNGIDDDANGYVDDYYGWNFVNNNNSVADGYGHGTHVAGTIAAVGNNGKGVVGVAYSSRILPVRILGDDGSGFMSVAAQGLIYAADRGARVINNSWGGPYTQVVNDAVAYAHSRGAVVVAAAGNSYGVNTDTSSPGGSAYALTVSAIDSNSQLANFSNTGIKLDIAAPGVDVLSTLAPNSYFATNYTSLVVGARYLRISGTSMATPHVAGAAALLLSQQPALTNEQVRYWLRAGAQDLGSTGFDDRYGYGGLRADASLDLAAAGTAPAVVGALNQPYRGAFANGPVAIRGEARGPAFASYELAYTRSGGNGTYTTFKTASTPVSGDGALLGSLDTTTLQSSDYIVRLRVKSAAGTYIDYFDHVFIDGTMRAGWPQVLSTDSFSGNGSWEFESTLVDLDGDGVKEIVTATHTAIFAHNANGTLRAGFPYVPGSSCEIAGSVSAGDINGDGRPELVFPCWAWPISRGTIGAIDADGRSLSGFPAGVITNNTISGTYAAARGHVALTDVNGDGRLDIVNSGIVSNSDLSRGQTFIVAVNSQGQTLPGWPQVLPAVAFNSDIAISNGRNLIGDIDRDGTDDIVVNDLVNGNARLAVYRTNGTLLRSIDLSSQYRLVFDPLLVDVNGDGVQEFATLGCNKTDNLIYATVFSTTGQTLTGWPRAVTAGPRNCDSLSAPFTLVDLDGDNKLEFIVGTDSSLRAFNSQGVSLAGWPKNVGTNFSGVNISVAQMGSNGPALLFYVDQRLWALDRNGNALPNWPKGMPIAGSAAPAVGTLDNAGRVAIVVNAPVTFDNYDSQLMVFEENLAAGAAPYGCTGYRCNARRTGTVAPVVVAWNKVYNQVYLRGTNNAWATTTPMTLVGHNTWEVTTTFGSTTTERFKFDINGDWAINFGDTNRDLVADAAGSDILVTQGAGSYKIRFNDSTKVYSVTRVGAANQAPVANAGPNQTITSSVPVSVTLNGTASSDSDGTIAGYAWAEYVNSAWVSVGSTATVTLSNVSVGQHRYRLTVTDNQGAPASAEVLVTISAGGYTKVYNQVYVRGTNNAWATTGMTLVANNTWEVTATFGSTTTERFKFDINGDWAINFGDTNRDLVADAAGSDILVTQGAGGYKIRFNDSTKVYSVTRVSTTNANPVANAGPDQTITSSVATSVTLNGTASSDSDGTLTAYAWDEYQGTSWVPVGTGSTLTLAGVAVGQHRYRLTVTDNGNASASDEVIVTITAAEFTKTYTQVYVRGTNNNWGTTSMTLVANNTWEATVTFGATTTERFKFDINANWTLNFGDTNADGVADQSGSDIPVRAGAGSYKIRFNDATKVYTVTRL